MVRRQLDPDRRPRRPGDQRPIARAPGGARGAAHRARLLRVRAERLPAAPARGGERSRAGRDGRRGALPPGGARAMSRLGRVALVLAAIATATPAADTARVVVQRMTNAALDVLRDRGLDAETKRHKLEEIVYAETDFDTMSRLVLARNWAQFSPAQQAEFVHEFKQHLSLTYGRNIENYRNERVEIVGDQDEGRDDWLVKTKILRGGGAQDILGDYRLRKAGGAWRVIHLGIQRVSPGANFRAPFQEIVSQGGPEKVLQLLRDKNARGEPLAT